MKVLIRLRRYALVFSRIIAPETTYLAFWLQIALLVAIAATISYRITAGIAADNPSFTDPDGNDALVGAVEGLFGAAIILPIGAALAAAHVCANLAGDPFGPDLMRMRWWKRFAWSFALPSAVVASAFTTWAMSIALGEHDHNYLYGVESGDPLSGDVYFHTLITFGSSFILLFAAAISLARVTGLLRRL
ncbi:MAG TPA: hypothetical protein VGM59_08665 [Dongiaceae bacterium]